MNFTAKRINRNYRQTINAGAEAIFPLLCPVREAEWLAHWRYRMIYSVTGIAEKGAVFITPFEGTNEQVWVVTKFDRQNYEIEFARMVPGVTVSTLNINVIAGSGESSYVDIKYEYTAISEKGNEFLESYSEEVFIKDMKRWEDSMNYYLKTGDMLK